MSSQNLTRSLVKLYADCEYYVQTFSGARALRRSQTMMIGEESSSEAVTSLVACSSKISIRSLRNKSIMRDKHCPDAKQLRSCPSGHQRPAHSRFHHDQPWYQHLRHKPVPRLLFFLASPRLRCTPCCSPLRARRELAGSKPLT
jgi:hypothetical protein